MRVTVFGGANPKPGEAGYEEAFRLGGLLAQAGHDVLNGGYIGTMEAVSRGAKESGGQVVGVTCEEIETWRSVAPNIWITQEVRCKTLMQRLQYLTDECDAAIALAGGIGTLLEISLVWNRLAIAAMKPKPLVLVGAGWQEVFNELFAQMGHHIVQRDRRWLIFCGTVEEAVQLILKPRESE
jgi:uncharacterized protein (TIGR00725 family)